MMVPGVFFTADTSSLVVVIDERHTWGNSQFQDHRWPITGYYNNYNYSNVNGRNRRERRAGAALNERKKPYYANGRKVEAQSSEGRRVSEFFRAAAAYERPAEQWLGESPHQIIAKRTEAPRTKRGRQRAELGFKRRRLG